MGRYDKKKKENRRLGASAFVLFGVIALITGAYAIYFAPTHTEYRYNIKAEQVYDNDKINQSVKLQNLSKDEQELLYDAFKKSDHFMGGAEVTVSKRERLETFDGWKVVEFQGVYLLVAISGPTTETVYSGWFPWLVAAIAWFSSICALAGLKEVLIPSRY